MLRLSEAAAADLEKLRVDIERDAKSEEPDMFKFVGIATEQRREIRAALADVQIVSSNRSRMAAEELMQSIEYLEMLLFWPLNWDSEKNGLATPADVERAPGRIREHLPRKTLARPRSRCRPAARSSPSCAEEGADNRHGCDVQLGCGARR